MRCRSSVAVLLCILLIGCGQHDGVLSGPVQSKIVEELSQAPNPGLYMAYERSIELDVEVGQIADIYHSLETACREATADQCVILEATLGSGDWTHARLRMRARPAGIQRLIASVSSRGTVVNQSVSAEDLAAPIGDASRRIEMLTDYRTKLEALRGPASSNIDALIKVNKELAEVQSQIESLTGEKSQLTRRVETEVLTVQITSMQERAFWRPVGEAVSSFATNLANGVASAITAIAFLLPWIVVVTLLVCGIRKWRARRRPA